MDQRPSPSEDFLQTSQALKRTAFVVIVLSGIVTILTFGFPNLFRGGIDEEPSLVLAGGTNRISPLYKVTKATTTPVTVVFEGEEKQALDMVRLSDGSTVYALIESGEPLSADIYHATNEGALTRLTNTRTVKSNLAADPAGAHVVYEEATIQNVEALNAPLVPSITQLTLASREVITVTDGAQPRYIKTGALLIGQEDGVAVVAPQAESEASTILSIETYSLYAVNDDGTIVAAYNRKTKMVDMFTVTETGTLSYDYSARAESQPMNLAFSDGKAVSAVDSLTQNGMAYQVTFYGHRTSTWNLLGVNGPPLQRILYVTQ